MILDTPDKLRALAGALERVANVAEHRRGQAVEKTSCRQTAALLRDKATALEAGELDLAEATALRGALDGMTIHAADP